MKDYLKKSFSCIFMVMFFLAFSMTSFAAVSYTHLTLPTKA